MILLKDVKFPVSDDSSETIYRHIQPPGSSNVYFCKLLNGLDNKERNITNINPYRVVFFVFNDLSLCIETLAKFRVV